MKKSFSLLEIILVITLLAILASFIIPKKQISDLDLASSRVELYLKHTRHLALMDDKFDHTDEEWFRTRWKFKVMKCQKERGLYFVIYSNMDKGRNVDKSECAKDPLTQKYLYSTNHCTDKQDSNKYVQLTRYYGVTDVWMSCNDTTSFGEIVFGNNGKIYSKFGKTPDEYEIKEPCLIELFDKEGNSRSLKVYPTGYISTI